MAGLTKKADLRGIIETTVHLHEDGNIDRFSLTGPDLEVGPRAVLSPSLVLHELATNAVKYGALSAHGGKVKVDWDLIKDGEVFQLRWSEHNGPTVIQPSVPGFGTRLIKSGIAGQSSEVTLDFDPSGPICKVQVALTDLQADS